MSNGHIDALEKIIKDQIMERRAIAMQYADAPDPTEVADKLEKCQSRIDALLLAMEHEKQLELNPAAFW